MSNLKTNAMRILDSNKIDYKMYSYETKKGEHIDGVEVAQKIGKNASQVYKTLVAQGISKNIYVYVIPVDKNLDLKKAAKVANEKSVAMINVNDINKFTGYVRGGCSPIGMKKIYKTFVNDTAELLDNIIISAGKIGYQVELAPNELQMLIEFKFEDLIK
ncbi:Cys-tRNA(Pro) deacylase [Romboutsia sp. 13368]|uniref:Cys-tRNA(Pro) deacylase n=1 Tax=Romboutsia sp. 13368 TaxID=2708053 RepID=UPI0025F21170|nr:Cys-tRNA(Pro) deacylase [Romboutsia sp. 13368]